MEILQVYAHAYVELASWLSMISTFANPGPLNSADLAVLLVRLKENRPLLVTTGLRMTVKQMDRMVDKLEHSNYEFDSGTISELENRFIDELQTHLFFQIQAAKSERFLEPLKGWEEIETRFPEASTDIEEMNKCFALSRYPAAVFHSAQVIEHGLVHLGRCIGSEERKPGWVDTSRKLEQILKYPEKRTPFQVRHLAFIEQMQATVQSLMTAWRHKISHSSGRLSLLPGAFAPDVAEEIIMATKSFMRRLATEMPEREEAIDGGN